MSDVPDVPTMHVRCSPGAPTGFGRRGPPDPALWTDKREDTRECCQEEPEDQQPNAEPRTPRRMFLNRLGQSLADLCNPTFTRANPLPKTSDIGVKVPNLDP